MWKYDYTEEEQETKKYQDLYEIDDFMRTTTGGFVGYNRWGEQTYYDKDGNFMGIVKGMESEIKPQYERVLMVAKLYYANLDPVEFTMEANRYQRDFKKMWAKAKSEIKETYKNFGKLRESVMEEFDGKL